jgi:hypothetical protein
MSIQEGSSGCWSGPVAYEAPGYLEGASITSNLPVFAISKSKEIVYSFAKMEKQYFDVLQFGFSLQVGATLTQYYGLAFNFNNVDSLESTYQGPFVYLSVGGATGFPGIAQLGTGVIGFKSVTNDVWGVSQYYSISFGISIATLPIPFTQVNGELGVGRAFPSDRLHDYILPSGRVDVGRLVSDIASGVDSKAVVPVPAVLVRSLSMVLAFEYSRIHDEIYINSR